jgi:hypothetical protein
MPASPAPQPRTAALALTALALGLPAAAGAQQPAAAAGRPAAGGAGRPGRAARAHAARRQPARRLPARLGGAHRRGAGGPRRARRRRARRGVARAGPPRDRDVVRLRRRLRERRALRAAGDRLLAHARGGRAAERVLPAGRDGQRGGARLHRRRAASTTPSGSTARAASSGCRSPSPRTHPASLWEFRTEHALARLAARRGRAAEARRHVAAARRLLDADTAMAARSAASCRTSRATWRSTRATRRRRAAPARGARRAGQRERPVLPLPARRGARAAGEGGEARAAYQRAYDRAGGHNPPAAFTRPAARRKLAAR